MRRRELTTQEAAILKMIEDGYGSANSTDEVFFSEKDDAVIFVKASDGTMPLCANLTNLAAWRADGTISSDEELKKDWLQIQVT
jgi:hypothetical protein